MMIFVNNINEQYVTTIISSQYKVSVKDHHGHYNEHYHDHHDGERNHEHHHDHYQFIIMMLMPIVGNNTQ